MLVLRGLLSKDEGEEEGEEEDEEEDAKDGAEKAKETEEKVQPPPRCMHTSPASNHH